jgi:uncharacterized protein YegL
MRPASSSKEENVSMQFTLEAFFNPYLPVGGSRLDAIITVTAGDDKSGAAPRARTAKAVAYLVDCSGSMADGNKMQMAKVALRQAIGLLDEDCLFSIIAFSSHAHVAVSMRPANKVNKNAARDQINMLDAQGGTCMSTALRAARVEFAKAPDAIPYAQFLTDGENNDEDRMALGAALRECEGRFTCDCWGVGVQWRPDELRQISGRLLGTADAVPDPDHLEMRFREALARVLSKGVGDVRLRLQLPRTSKIATVKQMRPEIVDLSQLATAVDERNIDVPTGAWSPGESRDYHVAFTVEPQAEGEEMMACRPKVVYSQDGAEVEADGDRIVATWTTDETMSTRIDPNVAHYTGQEELAGAIREGLEAKARGNVDEATVLLGKAAKIAIQTGNDEVTARLKKVVDVIDPDAGTVRLKSGADKGADLELDMGGTRTVRRRPAAQQEQP